MLSTEHIPHTSELISSYISSNCKVAPRDGRTYPVKVEVDGDQGFRAQEAHARRKPRRRGHQCRAQEHVCEDGHKSVRQLRRTAMHAHACAGAAHDCVPQHILCDSEPVPQRLRKARDCGLAHADVYGAQVDDGGRGGCVVGVGTGCAGCAPRRARA